MIIKFKLRMNFTYCLNVKQTSKLLWNELSRTNLEEQACTLRCHTDDYLSN